jgi:antirestriction protein ArdC
MLLWGSDYSSLFWLTFGGSVRRGERSERIVFYKQLTEREDDTAADESSDSKKPGFMLTYYSVFNVEQCDGLQIPEVDQPIRSEIETDAACEAIVTNWSRRPAIRMEIKTESRAYYRCSTDSVHLPARFRFVDTGYYYATLFHELIHSTGHESRLARTFGDRFGDELYSKEELIAETGAAFLCALSGITTEHTERNTTAYLQHWISALRKDNRMIVQAPAAAQKAVDMIVGESFAGDGEDRGANEGGA